MNSPLSYPDVLVGSILNKLDVVLKYLQNDCRRSPKHLPPLTILGATFFAALRRLLPVGSSMKQATQLYVACVRNMLYRSKPSVAVMLSCSKSGGRVEDAVWKLRYALNDTDIHQSTDDDARIFECAMAGYLRRSRMPRASLVGDNLNSLLNFTG